ncbi:uncharacterized protein TNCV_2267271 [Trichonephila clavipes]|nr:uncharacterized protein TNCV_2267271 [Trichonephila clavipes]
MINFVVLIAVLYDLLWFINVNEQNIKKWAFVISLLKEDETDQGIEEPDEIMHINRDSESKYEKSDRHETFESAVPLGLGSNPIEDTDACNCIVTSRHGGTLNSRQAASPLVRLVKGEERWEVPHPPGCSPPKLGWNRAKCHLHGAQIYG